MTRCAGNDEILLRLNEMVKSRRGEMSVRTVYRRMEMEEAMRILERRRRDIINASKSAQLPNEVKEADQCDTDRKDEKNSVGVPFFWIRVMNAMGIFVSYSSSEEDVVALSYLNDVRVQTLPPSFNSENKTIKMGRELTFCFDPNPYFTNTELVVQMRYLANENCQRIETTSRLIPKTDIHWKVNLVDINPCSFFNVFLSDNDHELEDFEVLECAFDNFNTKVMNYFYECN